MCGFYANDLAVRGVADHGDDDVDFLCLLPLSVPVLSRGGGGKRGERIRGLSTWLAARFGCVRLEVNLRGTHFLFRDSHQPIPILCAHLYSHFCPAYLADPNSRQRAVGLDTAQTLETTLRGYRIVVWLGVLYLRSDFELIFTVIKKFCVFKCFHNLL